MLKAGDVPGRCWRNVGFFLTALLVVVADQLSKLWVRQNLPLGHSIPEIGFFQLTHVQNTGAAFGLFRGHWFPLTVIALVGVAALLVYALSIHRWFPFLDNMLAKPTLGLVLGGTVGNLTDRLTTDFHYVTDFISIGIWPAFNLADSAIVVGVIIFAYSLLRLAKAEKRSDEQGI